MRVIDPKMIQRELRDFPAGDHDDSVDARPRIRLPWWWVLWCRVRRWWLVRVMHKHPAYVDALAFFGNPTAPWNRR